MVGDINVMNLLVLYAFRDSQRSKTNNINAYIWYVYCASTPELKFKITNAVDHQVVLWDIGTMVVVMPSEQWNMEQRLHLRRTEDQRQYWGTGNLTSYLLEEQGNRKLNCGILCYTLHSKNCVRVSVRPAVCLSVSLNVCTSVRQRIVIILCWEHL